MADYSKLTPAQQLLKESAFQKKLKTHLSRGQRARTRKRYAALENILYPDPNKSLSGKDIVTQATNQVNSAYAPQERAIAQRQVDIPAWYQNYLNEVTAGQTATKGVYDAAAQAATDRATNMANMSNTSNADLFAKLRSDAEKRGAILDPNLQIQAQQAVQNRQNLGNTFATGIGSVGANAFARSNTTKEIAGRDQIAQLAANTNKGTALAQQKAADIVKARQDLTDKERTFMLEQAGFGLKQNAAALSAANTESLIRSRKQNASLQKKKFRSAAEKDAYERAHHLGPYKLPKTPAAKKPKKGLGSNTSAQEGKLVDSIDQAIHYARKYMSGKDVTQKQVRQWLLEGVNSQKGAKGSPAYAKWIVNAAMDVAYLKKLSRPNVAELHRRGVHVKNRGWGV